MRHWPLILQCEARSDDTNELGADFMAAPPDHLVSAFPDNTAAGQEQFELNFDCKRRALREQLAFDPGQSRTMPSYYVQIFPVECPQQGCDS
jgi:hypothetical protein